MFDAVTEQQGRNLVPVAEGVLGKRHCLVVDGRELPATLEVERALADGPGIAITTRVPKLVHPADRAGNRCMKSLSRTRRGRKEPGRKPRVRKSGHGAWCTRRACSSWLKVMGSRPTPHRSSRRDGCARQVVKPGRECGGPVPHCVSPTATLNRRSSERGSGKRDDQ